MKAAETLREQAARYRAQLAEDVLPFWLDNGVDHECGGFYSCLDRDGSLLDDDKSGWVQGRFTWLLARLHTEFDPEAGFDVAAKAGIDFITKNGFSPDGRMWFQLDRAGRGLRKRRYAYTEYFCAMAFAEWFRVSGDEAAREEAVRLFSLACEDMRGGRGPGKFEPVRQAKALGVPMITLGVAHVLEDCDCGGAASEYREFAVDELRSAFTHQESGALLESVGLNDDLSRHLDGRLVNPGHSIEAAWFLMEEHHRRGGDGLLADALRTLEGSWALGWDDQHGGILSLVDTSGAPVQELWAELKLWWPHCEAILAFLYAARATGDPSYLERWRLVHDWAHAHFPDPDQGEWFGYLRRDGTVFNRAKGNLWKGPFHVPRMQLLASSLCDEIAGGVKG
jgi:N-acylglucosamine 2-epimerase